MGTKDHGMVGTRIYKTWERMKYRCFNPRAMNYQKYGARGITVCEEWKHSFKSFYDWAMANGYRDDLTIDRIDVNGNYEPSNCRWITMLEQQNNRRSNRYITYNGETHTMADWCRILNLPYKVVKLRITSYGWSAERAFTVPVRGRANHTLTSEILS
jgi:hypothetical protein